MFEYLQLSYQTNIHTPNLFVDCDRINAKLMHEIKQSFETDAFLDICYHVQLSSKRMPVVNTIGDMNGTNDDTAAL